MIPEQALYNWGLARRRDRCRFELFVHGNRSLFLRQQQLY